VLFLFALSAEAGPSSKVIPAADLAWTDVKRPDGTPVGLRAVDLWGDSAKGAHGSLASFPAGLTEPMHYHSAAIRVVVIAGTMRYVIGGVESKNLSAGSYVTVEGGVPHFAHCMPGAPCEVFLEQDAAMDVKLVK
jgi:quercetin dioxygenase-like cupin family protein